MTMRLHTSTHSIDCPYCGEVFDIIIDESEPWQEYIEDCWVCCRPIVIGAAVDDGEVRVTVRSEND